MRNVANCSTFSVIPGASIVIPAQAGIHVARIAGQARNDSLGGRKDSLVLVIPG